MLAPVVIPPVYVAVPRPVTKRVVSPASVTGWVKLTLELSPALSASAAGGTRAGTGHGERLGEITGGAGGIESQRAVGVHRDAGRADPQPQ